jgi:hypothetical protein
MSEKTTIDPGVREVISHLLFALCSETAGDAACLREKWREEKAIRVSWRAIADELASRLEAAGVAVRVTSQAARTKFIAELITVPARLAYDLETEAK